jgi:hypothetical protein
MPARATLLTRICRWSGHLQGHTRERAESTPRKAVEHPHQWPERQAAWALEPLSAPRRIHDLGAARMRLDQFQQLGIGGPAIPGQQPLRTARFDSAFYCHHPVDAQTAERIGYSFRPAAATQKVLPDPARPAFGARRMIRDTGVHTHHICAGLYPLEHGCQLSRVIGEVGLQRDDHITFWILRPSHRFTNQELERIGVPEPLLDPDNGQRQHSLIRTQHLIGVVTGPVIRNEDLVVAREISQHLADFPEQHADRSFLVVCRNADVYHVTVSLYFIAV